MQHYPVRLRGSIKQLCMLVPNRDGSDYLTFQIEYQDFSSIAIL